MDIDARRALVKELNLLTRELQGLGARLEKLEAHEGDDGCPEDVDAQCSLIDLIAAKNLRLKELRRIVYPK